MPIKADPVEGNWYEFVDEGRSFFIVTVDEDEGIIEIQDYDGAVDEIELAAWHDLDLEPIDPPEDWLGFLEDLESEDTEDYEVQEMDATEWSEPLDEIDD
jgi:hypothetical protein